MAAEIQTLIHGGLRRGSYIFSFSNLYKGACGSSGACSSRSLWSGQVDQRQEGLLQWGNGRRLDGSREAMVAMVRLVSR
jgi:hypothetical protein